MLNHQEVVCHICDPLLNFETSSYLYQCKSSFHLHLLFFLYSLSLKYSIFFTVVSFQKFQLTRFCYTSCYVFFRSPEAGSNGSLPHLFPETPLPMYLRPEARGGRLCCPPQTPVSTCISRHNDSGHKYIAAISKT